MARRLTRSSRPSRKTAKSEAAVTVDETCGCGDFETAPQIADRLGWEWIGAPKDDLYRRRRDGRRGRFQQVLDIEWGKKDLVEERDHYGYDEAFTED